MFSALKKLTVGGTRHEGEVITPPGLQTMSKILQSKFSKGVQYNMKIIIKGDRNVGKSCLFNRLQGRGFTETYTQTEEIQVTSIQWNYKATDDVVKVEVWDVVDKGKKRVMSDNLKLELSNGAASPEVADVPALDAEFLNVYKGTNGVILMMDITKSWTFEYVQREITKIPSSIPVLVLGNHCDMSHHRSITPDYVLFYLETLQRSAPARYAESSMSNGFGLKFLHKWFNLPFLQLQRETLLAQLNTNQNEITITTQELDLYQQTDDSNYKIFLERLTARRRQVAEAHSTAPTSGIVVQTQHSFPSVNVNKPETKPSVVDEKPSVPEEITAVPVEKPVSSLPKAVVEIKTHQSAPPVPPPNVPSKNDSSVNIEEFVPDDYLDKSFLDEVVTTTAIVHKSAHNESDSENEVSGNPLVSGFQDDLDPDDAFLANDTQETNEGFTSVNSLNKWMSAERRGSPDGGDDSSKINNDNDIQSTKRESRKSKSDDKSKKKKSSSKKKPAKVSTEEDTLENFLNDDSPSAYEAL
ncbi:rab-like protein 6 isoform X1 [Planococcus citri]|uniref:rab-like protein 6 isoform X1 n=1 Tax=Planococcus citri TaxID=170843 RepID=UPI0031F9F169